MKRLVIFDVDGLLLNTEFSWQKLWGELGKSYGYPQLGEAFKLIVGITGDDTRRVMHENMPEVPVSILDAFLEQARSEGAAYVLQNLKLMPGALDLLEHLKKNNIMCAVATTTDRYFTDQRLAHVNVTQYFRYITCGDEVKKRKPDPEIYLRVLEKTGIRKEDALVLEDSGYGVEAAYHAGIDVIMVPSINPPKKEDKERSMAIINSLAQVPEYLN